MSKRIAIIPARRGSKGLPKKNILMMNGRPLVEWTIECAIESNCFDEIVVSTDDPQVVSIVASYEGVSLHNRPEYLGEDNVPGIEVVIDVLKSYPGFKFGILLQPTSPLRLPRDIQRIIDLASDSRACSVVSVTEVKKPPNWMFHLTDKTGLLKKYEKSELVPDRHENEKLYVLNGALYFFDTKWLLKNRSFISEETIGFKMPAERSIDIDCEFDFKLSELLQKNVID